MAHSKIHKWWMDVFYIPSSRCSVLFQWQWRPIRVSLDRLNLHWESNKDSWLRRNSSVGCLFSFLHDTSGCSFLVLDGYPVTDVRIGQCRLLQEYVRNITDDKWYIYVYHPVPAVLSINHWPGQIMQTISCIIIASYDNLSNNSGFLSGHVKNIYSGTVPDWAC